MSASIQILTQMPMSMLIDVGGDGDAFVDVHLHNVFHARAHVDVDGEVDVEDSAGLYRCQCRCTWRPRC